MLKITDMSLKIKNNFIFKNITITVHNSDIHILLGPSGCGKTSLLRIIAGFEKPFSGTVSIDDKIVSDTSHILQPNVRNIAMIFQNLALWPHMTVEKHLAFMLDNRSGNNKKAMKMKVQHYLQQMHLLGYEKRYPQELSGGQKQRLAIARALAAEAKYLLMDEPFTNLDEFLRNEMIQTVKKLRDAKEITILYVTHTLEEACLLADNVTFMLPGENAGTTMSGDKLRAMKKHDIITMFTPETL